MLIELGNSAKAIPYYAVYKPGSKPVHFDGLFLSPGQFLDKFKEETGIEQSATAVANAAAGAALDR